MDTFLSLRILFCFFFLVFFSTPFHVNAQHLKRREPIKTNWARIEYGSVKVNDCEVRSIIYYPLETDKHAGIFFIPGYNCGSIENYHTNFNGRMIEGWVRHGYTVYTVEKSGMGESYGCLACEEVDLQTDIELYEAALRDFFTLPNIDSNQRFIWGHSMGGIIAPLIARDKPIRGIMVFGTVFRPWSEFLLEMHRIQKPLTDSLSYSATETFTRLIQRVYYEFFVLKKSPSELYQQPSYQKIVETELEYKAGKTSMWGRHWRFWQQLDSINLAEAWQHQRAHVLVLHGASDFIQCAAVEPYLITEAVNQVHPGHAKAITLQHVDHLMMNSRNFKEAVTNFNEQLYRKGNFNSSLLDSTIDWLQQQN